MPTTPEEKTEAGRLLEDGFFPVWVDGGWVLSHRSINAMQKLTEKSQYIELARRLGVVCDNTLDGMVKAVQKWKDDFVTAAKANSFERGFQDARETIARGLVIECPETDLVSAIHKHFTRREVPDEGAAKALTPTEQRLAGKLLRLAADRFSNHGCNDFYLTKDGGLTEGERQEIAPIVARWANGGEEDEHLAKSDCQYDWMLMNYLADRLGVPREY